MIQRAPGIWEIELHDKEKEVSEIRIYLVQGNPGERSLLVDAGFGNQECLGIMNETLKKLKIRYEDLDIFLTHKHHDHCGLASTFAGKGARLFMNPQEERHSYDCLYYRADEKSVEEQRQVLKTVGVTPQRTPELWNKYMEVNERLGKKQGPWIYTIEDYPYIPVTAGQKFAYGIYRFEAVPLCGHTMGQMGLFDETHRILFSADQVIAGIVPIVGTTHPDEHLLEHYFHSLSQFKKTYGDCTIFPAHNGPLKDTSGLVDKIAFAYLNKMNQIKDCVEEGGEQTVWEVARKAYRIREIPQEDDDFVIVKSMISKTFSCLEYLYDRELVKRRELDGMLFWSGCRQEKQ